MIVFIFASGILIALAIFFVWQSKTESTVVFDEREMLYDAWVVIANSPGWGTDEKWREAAEQWRDHWHAYLDATRQ